MGVGWPLPSVVPLPRGCRTAEQAMRRSAVLPHPLPGLLTPRPRSAPGDRPPSGPAAWASTILLWQGGGGGGSHPKNLTEGGGGVGMGWEEGL